MISPSKHIQVSIWALPMVALLYTCFTAIWAPGTPHVLLMLRTFGMSLGFSSIANFIYRRTAILGPSVFMGIAALMVFGMTPRPLQYIFWFLTIPCIFTELKSFIKDSAAKQWLNLWATVLILTVVLLPYFSMENSEPFNEAKISNSYMHIDTLYHLAVASMLKNYHVISHGFHGLGQLEYHFGSHLLMASVSALAGLTVTESYSYFFTFFCVPLLGILIISTAEEIVPSKNSLHYFLKLIGFSFLMLGTGVLFIGSFLSRFGLWHTFFESESFSFSLIIFLCLLSTLHLHSLIKSFWLQFLTIVGIFALMTIAKISTAFCALAFVGSWALLSKEQFLTKKWLERWLIFLACSASFVLLFQFINPGMGDGHIEPFQFVDAYIKFAGPFWLKLVLFLGIHFIFPISVLSFVFLNLKMPIFKESFYAWWGLGTLISLAIGIGVILLMYIEGGGGSYFSNLSMFAALPILVCLPQMIIAGYPNNWQRRLAAGLLVIFSLLGFYIYGPEEIGLGTKNFLDGMRLSPIENSLWTYVKNLRIIRDDPTSSNAVVYIPRSDPFWTMMPCRRTSYFIPAISEHPALYAWPTTECYNFICGPRFHSNGLCEKSQKDYTDEQLITEAKLLGFKRVDIVSANGVRSLQ